jgi:hypothetical protein
VAIAAGDPGWWSGRMKLASSTPAPPSWGRSRRISVRAGYADDGVEKLALQERAAFDVKSERDEERRHGVEVGHRDSDVVEPPNARHEGILQA